MNKFTFALWAGAGFGVAVLYKVATLQLALAAREAMVDEVRAIMTDPNASDELKYQALAAFHAALVPNILVRSALPWRRRAPREEDQFCLPAKKELARLDRLVREHFLRVNMLAGLHWYALLFVALLPVALVVGLLRNRWTRGADRLARVEDLIIHPKRCWKPNTRRKGVERNAGK